MNQVILMIDIKMKLQKMILPILNPSFRKKNWKTMHIW